MIFGTQIFLFLLYGLILLTTSAKNDETKRICKSDQCKRTADLFRKNMQNSAIPCHNFYQFMCGNFQRLNPLGPGEEEKSSFDIRKAYIDETVKAFLENDKEQSPSLQKARITYQNCIDEAVIDQLGDIPIPLELGVIGFSASPPFSLALDESYDFSRLLAKIHRYLPFTHFLFEVSVASDVRDATKNHFFFDYTPSTNHFIQAEIPKELEMFKFRWHISEEEAKKNKIRNRKLLKKMMRDVVTYMNRFTRTKLSKNKNDLIEKRITEVVNFLIKLEETKNLENPAKDGVIGKLTYTTLVQLQEETDKILAGENVQIKINWLDYVEALFEGIHDDARQRFQNGELVVIRHMRQFKAVLKLISKVSKKIFVSAIWWIVAHSVSPFATEKLRNFYYKYLAQISDNVILPRETRCLEIVKNQFSFLFAHVLIRDQEDSSKVKSEILEMMTNIRRSYEETITQSTWLDPGTKMAALNKLKYMTQTVSFEEWMKNPGEIDKLYDKIVVIRGLHYASMRWKQQKARNQMLALLGQENSTNELDSLNPSEVNASYSPDSNTIDIPIGILGPPFYGLGLQALNYGAIGSILGHELGHGFDNSGKGYDSWGKMTRWWKKKTDKKYNQKTKCFVDFYNAIKIPEAGRTVNGKLTLGENIADYLGFKFALKAYEKYVEVHGQEEFLPHFEHYSHEKLFTMAFAMTFCQVVARPYLQRLLEKNEHAPEKARALGVLKNSEEFAQIWKCSDNSEMNPKNKCVLW